jgi:hypothetical protein
MLALAHLVRVLRGQPHAPSLAAGEVITTGTITDAWPVEAGEAWSSDYGTLGMPGLTLFVSPDIFATHPLRCISPGARLRFQVAGPRGVGDSEEKHDAPTPSPNRAAAHWPRCSLTGPISLAHAGGGHHGGGYGYGYGYWGNP